jgi:hypothetical protein
LPNVLDRNRLNSSSVSFDIIITNPYGLNFLFGPRRLGALACAGSAGGNTLAHAAATRCRSPTVISSLAQTSVISGASPSASASRRPSARLHPAQDIRA